MIRLNGVSRNYLDGEREIHALSPLSLRVARGETVVLTGKSGSGKSTLLHLMGGLEWPTTGEVSIDGLSLQGMSDAELTAFRLRRIGFVFQFFHLIPTLNVLQNVTLPAEMAGLGRKEGRGRARALLEDVGLAERAGAMPAQLSGGEQQRVAVARALVLSPPVLLADEPTGNLDSETGDRVLDLLWGLSAARGSTLVVATHSLEISGRASRAIVLRDGRILTDSGDGDPATGPEAS